MPKLLRWIQLSGFVKHPLKNSHTGVTLCGLQTSFFGGGPSGAPAPSEAPPVREQCFRCRSTRAFKASQI